MATVKVAAAETRMPDFPCEVDLYYFVLAQLLPRLLPAQGKLRRGLDRAE
ncbi:hypothetical protein [Hymenobacter psoromatis]|nr:hypothetical protein [Hymenobacter psoromatis]